MRKLINSIRFRSSQFFGTLLPDMIVVVNGGAVCKSVGGKTC